MAKDIADLKSSTLLRRYYEAVKKVREFEHLVAVHGGRSYSGWGTDTYERRLTKWKYALTNAARELKSRGWTLG